MAAININASDVLPATNAVYDRVAGEDIDAGMFLYLVAADNTAKKAVANSTVDKAQVVGIAVNSAKAGQPVSYMLSGNDVPVGGVLAQGKTYVLAATAGKCCLPADLASGHWLTKIGDGLTGSILRLAIAATGIQNP